MYRTQNVNLLGENKVYKGFLNLENNLYYFTEEIVKEILDFKEVPYKFVDNKLLVNFNGIEQIISGVENQVLINRFLIYPLNDSSLQWQLLINKAIFSIENIDNTFEGYTYGETWNGWACPYFTKDESDKVLKNMVDDYGSGFHIYDNENKRFIVGLSDEVTALPEYLDKKILTLSDDEILSKYEDVEVYNEMQLNYKNEVINVYPLGSGSWIWDCDKYID